MRYEQESYAKDLHDALMQELATLVPEAVVSAEGSGVHWNCDARKRERFCSISCFDVQGEPEYLIRFEHDAQTQAWGRTSQKRDTLSAVGRWLQGQELQLLYDRFEFIDRRKRSLTTIEMQAIGCCPELIQCAARELRHLSCDLYELWFCAKDRSCRISYYGKSDLPDFAFHWDECHFFQVQTEHSRQLALVMKRWLCDYTMPSDLEKEFPWIDTGQLAKYYEEGRGIEGEFVLSWNSIEWFYKKMIERPFSPKVLEMIAQMRKEGYNSTLRAGQSLYWLVVSRSRRHGLREDQPRITFRFTDDAMDVHANLDEETELSFPRIEFTPEVDALLKQLEAREID
jgi:hypothetical protein